ncbi:MAG: hypothetical protein GY950_16900 [bacterium]|nr:hypothetical protein [bacterium]
MKQMLLYAIIFLSVGIALAGVEGVGAYLPQPGDLKGWEASGKPEVVKGDDLFLMINGGAEVYHEYGFKQAAAQGFKNKNGKAFNLEIYEMKDAAAAYGIYTFKTGDSGKTLTVGDEGLLEEYYLNLWKGNFLVTVIGFDSEKETLGGIMAAAKVVAAKIKTGARKPGLSAMLPGKASGIKYLKGNLALYNQYEFDSRDIFGLKQGLMADYGDFRLFIFKYENEADCKKRFENAAGLLKENSRFTDLVVEGNGLSMTDDKGSPFYIVNDGQYIFIIQGKKKEEAKGVIRKIPRENKDRR